MQLSDQNRNRFRRRRRDGPPSLYVRNREQWRELKARICEEDLDTDIKVHVVSHKPVNGKCLHLYPIGDIHLGNKLHRPERLQPILDFILDDPDGYVIFLGDQAETATKQSVGKGVLDEDQHLNEQIESLYTLLQPLASVGKIVGIHEGNHEYRLEQMVGVDPMAWLARWLQVPYFGWQAFTRFEVGDQKYLVHSYHGKSAAQTQGGRLNAAQKLLSQAEADIFLSGHVHDPVYTVKARFVEDPEQNKIVKKAYHFFICTAWLDYFGGYADMQALPPSMIRPQRLCLMSDRKHVEPE